MARQKPTHNANNGNAEQPMPLDNDSVVVVPANDVPEIKLGKYDVLPPLSGEKYEALKESIRINGVQVPVEVDRDGYVLDGKARVRACRELSISDYPVIVRLDLTEDEGRDHAQRLNNQRRTPTQEQQRDLIREELVRDPRRNNNWIADTCGSTAPTVRRHRLECEAEGLIPVVDSVVCRDGTVQPARKPRRPVQQPPKPAVVVPTAEDVSSALESVSQVEACDLSGRLHTAAEITKIANDQRRNRELRERRAAGEGDGATACTDQTTDDADTPSDTDDEDPSEPEPDDRDQGHIDLMLADTTLAGAPTYAELAEIASVNLKRGTPLAVRVPTAEVAEAIRALGDRLEYTWAFVEALPNEIPVALPIPVEQRHRVTLLFRQPCPRTRVSHKQALVTDLIMPDGGYDPLAIVETLVGAYTHPGDTVLDLQGRDGIVGVCEGMGRSYTTDPEKPEGWELEPRHKRPVEQPSHVWSPGGHGDRALQLTADWESREIVSILRDGRRIAVLPVEYSPLSALLKQGGNDKTDAGVVGGIANACFRAALPHSGCGSPCYAVPGHCRGCYANLTRWSMRSQNTAVDYDVIHNGLVNDRATIRVPNVDDWSLAATPPLCDPHLWRVCSETAPGELAIALGLMQRYAAATPDHWFYAFCSHGVRPSDDALESLAALPNCWCIHTLSGAMSPSELDVRLESFARYLDFGIPSVAYVVTSSLWDNESVARRALELVPPEFLIEEPLRVHNNQQEPPLLGLNPLGRCSQTHCDECPLKCGFIPLTAAGLLRAPATFAAPTIAGPWAEEREMMSNVA